MTESAAAGLVAGWEDGDDICPPWPWPWPRKGDPGAGPLAEWLRVSITAETWVQGWLEKASPAVQDVYMTGRIHQIAELVPDKNLAGQIGDAAAELSAG